MSLKSKLATLQFLQFFVWGSWLITLGSWWFVTKQWSGAQLGIVFSTLGISSIFMPTLMGVVADRFINAEKLYGALHLCGACALFYIPHVNSPTAMFWIMLINMCCYMPTIPLLYTFNYAVMKEAQMSIIKEYPPIRAIGTVGFIAAMWLVSLLKLETSSWMFYIGGAAAVVLGLYSFSMPSCPPAGKKPDSLKSSLGLNAFELFKNKNVRVFLIFSMLLGAALQLTNAYGNAFLHSFASQYQNYLMVKYPAIILSISQMSEVGFMLTIPFFLGRFGIKTIMLMSIVAWILRFGLFAFGNPAGGLWMIIASCVAYGAAFDFFNTSGSLYMDDVAPIHVRASAQGLFMLMTNGLGAFFGSIGSGWAISRFFTGSTGVVYWQGLNGVWITFTIYSVLIGVLFTIFFKYKHKPQYSHKRAVAPTPY